VRKGGPDTSSHRKNHLDGQHYYRGEDTDLPDELLKGTVFPRASLGESQKTRVIVKRKFCEIVEAIKEGGV